MPTIFSHGAVGFVASKLGFPGADRRIVITSIGLAVAPDLDSLFLSAIPYSHPLGHRGLSHSLLFALLLGMSVAFLFIKAGWSCKGSFWTLAALFSIVTASHGFFDAMTDGGLGVAFFAPFDNTRIFFPWRPIPVAPFSARRLLTPSGMSLLAWELALFGTFTVAAIIWDRHSMWRRVSASACAIAGIALWFIALGS